MNQKPYSVIVDASHVDEGDIVLVPVGLVHEVQGEMLPYLNKHTRDEQDYVSAYVFQNVNDRLAVVPLDFAPKGTKKTGIVIYDKPKETKQCLFVCKGKQPEYSINNRFAYREDALFILRGFFIDEILADLEGS